MRKIDVTLEHGATQRFEAGTPVGALAPAGYRVSFAVRGGHGEP